MPISISVCKIGLHTFLKNLFHAQTTWLRLSCPMRCREDCLDPPNLHLGEIQSLSCDFCELPQAGIFMVSLLSDSCFDQVSALYPLTMLVSRPFLDRWSHSAFQSEREEMGKGWKSLLSKQPQIGCQASPGYWPQPANLPRWTLPWAPASACLSSSLTPCSHLPNSFSVKNTFLPSSLWSCKHSLCAWSPTVPGSQPTFQLTRIFLVAAERC